MRVFFCNSVMVHVFAGASGQGEVNYYCYDGDQDQSLSREVHANVSIGSSLLCLMLDKQRLCVTDALFQSATSVGKYLLMMKVESEENHEQWKMYTKVNRL